MTRILRALVALAVVAPALAGCITHVDLPDDLDQGTVPTGTINKAALSEVRFDTFLHEVETVESTLDGVRLYSEVIRPDTDEPVPTILVLSPYGGNLYLRPPRVAQEPLEDFVNYPLQSLIDHFVPRGYAFALADVRGTGNSEGCMNLMGAKEQQDAKDVVEHFARAEWSNGKVGMTGGSYDGSTPLLAATMNAEGLATIVPVVGVRSFYHAMYMGGVGYPGFDRMPVTYAALAAIPPTNVEDGAAWAVNAADSITFCDQVTDEWSESMAPGKWDEGLYTDYWEERDFTSRIPNITASVFYTQGFHDENVKVDHVMDYFNAIEAPKKAWIGQWGHNWPQREDWMVTLHAWFDEWLKDIDTGIMDTPTVEIINNREELRYDVAWPPLDAEATTLYLDNADAALAPALPAEETTATYRANPARGNLLGTVNTGAAAGWLAGEDAEGQLTYVSAPLDAELYLAGEPRVTVHVATDAENTHVLTFLYEVDADGEWHYVSRGYWNLQLREGVDNPQPVSAGDVYALDVPLHPKEHAFAEGHQVGLVVKSVDPRASTTEFERATNTIVTGGDAASALVLPTLRAPDVRVP